MKRGALYGLFFGLMLLISGLIVALGNSLLESLILRLGVILIGAAGGAAILRVLYPRQGWLPLLVAALLADGVMLQLLIGENTGLLRYVSDYPFSLGWSEASRYTYASLWLSPALYGQAVPPSVLHPTRYLLQSLAFLVPNAPLGLHRLWQVLLFDGTALLTGWLLARRLNFTGARRLTAILYAFLFLLLPPVYYHLLIIPIVVLWGVDVRHFWRSLAVVLAASLWAGISRVNWVPMPGLLAAALYLLERPISEQPRNGLASSKIRYLLPPALWVLLGTAGGYLSKMAYQLWSGNPAEYFDSSLTSDLLWYRLLPNATYAPGILLAALWYALPLGCVILWALGSRWRNYHMLRLAGLAAMLAVLFAGGVVVSLKIGGGKGLHNLDAFWVLLLVIGAYVWAARFQPDVNLSPAPLSTRWRAILACALVLIPLMDVAAGSAPPPTFDAAQTQRDLDTLKAAVAQAAPGNGEILFIRERQLLLFGQIPGIPIVHDYELVFLTEMEMSENQAYLGRFYADLRQHRFSLIVSDPLSTARQGRWHEFGEENDAWAERVAEPLLCSYEKLADLPGVNDTVLLVPRANATDCP